ncbi:MAG: PD40 domain-containing protein, partial [Spirochaetes bacterium]|nr:PD40 domain-containing protein [Spirochaetota bacterium]
MKKYGAVILILSLFVFISCSENFTTNEGSAIKLVTVDNEPVSSLENNDVCISMASNSASPTGLSLFFASDRGGNYDIYIADLQTSGKFSNPTKITGLDTVDNEKHMATISIGSNSYIFFSVGTGNTVRVKPLAGSVITTVTNSGSPIYGKVLGTLPPKASFPDFTIADDEVGLVVAKTNSSSKYRIISVYTIKIADLGTAFSAGIPITTTTEISIGGGSYVPRNVFGIFRDSFVYSREGIRGDQDLFITDLSMLDIPLLIFNSTGDDVSPFYSTFDNKLYMANTLYHTENDKYQLYRWNRLTIEKLGTLSTTRSKTTWAKTYGGSGREDANDVIVVSDGYIVVGRTDSSGAGNDDAFVMKLNPYGDIVWQKTYGGSGYDVFNAVTLADDGNLVAVGRTASSGAGGSDVWAVKINASDGTKMLENTYGGSNFDTAYAVQKLTDGYAIVGETSSFGDPNGNAWILKLGITLNVTWQREYGGSGSDYAVAVTTNSANEIIVTGKVSTAGKDDLFVLSLNTGTGAKIADITNASANNQNSQGICLTASDDIMVVGWNANNANDVSFFNIESDMAMIQDQRTFIGSGDDRAYSVQQTSDGGYIIAGTTTSSGSGHSDFLLIKLSSGYAIEWQKTYGFAAGDEQHPVVRLTSDNGYIIAGQTESVGGNDILVIKLDQNGNPIFNGAGYSLG